MSTVSCDIPEVVTVYKPNFEVPDTIPEQLSDAERTGLVEQIKGFAQGAGRGAGGALLCRRCPATTRRSDRRRGLRFVEMARFGNNHSATTLVVAGVRFMGETAKILNPEKRVLMPDLDANCSLDLGCPAEQFSAFCDAHPEHTVVVYANTSAEVKARADWVVTSGSAVDIVRHLDQRGEKILWAPDRYLGDYVRTATGADMLIWNGSCVVHEAFKGDELEALRREHPKAKVLVHPESPPNVIAQADVVGSTTGLIKAVKELDADTFIVATDSGIFHKMGEAAPGKTLLEAPTAGRGATCKSCAHCPWMAMNGLRNLAACLQAGSNEIFIDEGIRRRAVLPIERLLNFAEQRNAELQLANDA